jgi:hypothetical protein
MANGVSPGSLEAQALQALLDVIKTVSSPDIAQAQAIMLRRLALEGDVISSRIPPPQNITEVGGYFNLVTKLKQVEMQAQMLAGALGIAGPNPPLGWLPTQPTVAWTTLPNDRPAGAAQGTIPLTLSVRNDFAPALQLALQGIHDRGCALPLVAPPQVLPATAAMVPGDLLPLIGRVMNVVPGVALRDPDNDVLAVARLGTDPYQLVARCLSIGPIGVNPGPWEAIQCTATAATTVAAPAGGRLYVTVGDILATAGFYPALPGYAPTSLNDVSWTRYVNLTGLVPGVTTLGSELNLLYPQNALAASGLASRLANVWTGSVFA